MDLFSKLDLVQPEATGEQPVMVRYRIRFHREITYSHLSTNPSMSQEEIAAAVAKTTGSVQFLPQPWPPSSLDDRTSILSVSLIKMKAIANVGLGLPEVNSVLLPDIISGRFPERTSIPTISGAITSCETRITHDGAVRSSFGWSDDPLFKGDESTRYKYVKAMLILGMQLYLESLG